MFARVRMLWVNTRDSLWFVPAVSTLLSGALAVTIISAERRGLVPAWHADHWLFGAGAEGARGMLSALAGGLITVTGVVFSVTIVALQLASSQFTPRVLRNFTADRSNQVVLGVFIGTFTYTLLVLRSVQSALADSAAFVPRVAVALALCLALVSIGFLIFFIHHAARSIQISVILERVSRLTLEQIDLQFAPLSKTAEGAVASEATFGPAGGEARAVLAHRAGYLQAVDGHSLSRLAERQSLQIQMERRIGEFILPGEVLATVRSAREVWTGADQAIRSALVLGPERTPEQDVEFGIIEISDIAVKALSPGINDPTTALHCIDRLGQILLALGNCHPARHASGAEGNQYFRPLQLTIERAVELAFDQITHFGASNPAIVRKLLHVLGVLRELIPAGERAPLVAQTERILAAAREELAGGTNLESLLDLHGHSRLRWEGR